VRPGSGRIRLEGKDITRWPAHRRVGAGLVLVPEGRQILGTLTVAENLRLGAYARTDRAAVHETLEEQFRLFPILAERRRQAAQTLSGGEQQMLAIARAMMSRPRLLLLDEPSLGLAPLMVERIMQLIRSLRDAGSTVLLVEQNARAALGVADRGYVLENGRIAASDSSARLLGDAAVEDAYLGGQKGGGRAIEERIRAKRRAILGR